jgi:uncharacterized paraquat-inducible protein A
MYLGGTHDSCLLCGHRMSEQGIAKAHFTKKCPACNEPIEVNAPGALTRSRGATAAGLVGMVLGLVACVVALTVFGIDEKTLNTWPSAWQAALAIAVIGTGTLLAYIFQRLQVKSVLARMRAHLQEQGLL